ncbi:MAG: hypothetical protein R2754_03265 [Microthrixaceae bacterium]
MTDDSHRDDNEGPSPEQRAEDVAFPWRFAAWWAAGIVLAVAVALLIDASELLGG